MKSLWSLVLVLGLPGLAVADDLGAPPASCPRGSFGHTEHAGEWCAATTCNTDADCSADGLRQQGLHYHTGDTGLVCREAALCVVTEEYALGGHFPADPPPTRTRRVARGECIDGTCPAGGTCGAVRRCVPATTEEPSSPTETPSTSPTPSTNRAPAEEPATDDQGGCAIGHGSLASAWLILGLALLGLTRRR